MVTGIRVVAGMLAWSLAVASPLQARDATSTKDAQPSATADSIRVGLALSGGGAKGLAHIGVLDVLEDAGVHVDVVAGTSMGSVVGGLYAMGLGTDSIRSIISGVDWSLVLADRLERGRRFLHERRMDERAVLTLPVEGGAIGLPAGASIGSSITRLAERATWPAATVRSFDELPRDFAAVATDIETGDAVTLTGGVLSQVMRASIGIPGALEPMELNGRLLVDGAVVRNLPASDARALGADVLICSDVSDELVGRDELGTLVDVLDQVVNLGMRRSTMEQRGLCDVLVRPDVEGISGLAFDRVEDWIERGTSAAERHREALVDVARRRGPAAVPLPADVLGDSVRVEGVRVEAVGEGVLRPQAEALILEELDIEPGDHVTAENLAYRLEELDATGLFGLIRYRLDGDGDAVALTLHVEERAQNRLGVGLRYDDERRAALLFTTKAHNVLRYGSLTRVDLRVGEETRAAISYQVARGVTGPLEGGLELSWSQGSLRLPETGRPETGIELTRLSGLLGLVVARNTHVGVEGLGEWTVTDRAGGSDVLLTTVSGILDHESLDRIDFPRLGAQVDARWEWGSSDVLPDEGFSVLSARGRVYLPVLWGTTLDLGGYVGVARGADLPAHRYFLVGGAHPSAIFERTQPAFAGLEPGALAGTVAQVGRIGLRWSAGPNLHVRVGLDAGSVADDWRLPLPDPVYGWSVSAGLGTVVGPVMVQWAHASTRSGGRVSVSVGRAF